MPIDTVPVSAGVDFFIAVRMDTSYAISVDRWGEKDYRSYFSTNGMTYSTGIADYGDINLRAKISAEGFNNAPVASADTVTTSEDTDYSGTLIASDGDGDALTFSIIDSTVNGTVTLSDPATGTFTYSPVENFNGLDSLLFSASDGILLDTGSVTIVVTTIDDLPVVANPLSDITVNEDALDTVVADLDVVFMDVDEELEYSHVIEDTSLVFASVTNDTVTLQFLPDANGSTNIIFTATNPMIRASVSDTMTITILPINDLPSDFSLLTPENSDTVYINLSNQNDSLLFQWEESIDPDGDSIQYIFGIVKVGGWGAPSFTLMYEDTLEQTHLSLSNIFIADSIAEIEEPDDTNDLVGCIWYVHAFDGLELNEQHHGLALDFSGYLVDWDFSLSEPVIEVMGTDNVWNPGDTISVEMDFCNNTNVAHNWYPGVTIESDSSLTSLHVGHIWFYAMVSDECHAISWGAIANTSIISDTIVTFIAYPEALNCHNQPDYCIDGDTLTFEVPIVVQVVSAEPEPFTPEEFSLHQNYPNPFNPVTTLRYDLPENGHVNVIIYDMLGKQVKTLINQTQDAGYRSVIWDGTNDYGNPVSAGIYLYQIQAGEYMQTKKMVLLK